MATRIRPVSELRRALVLAVAAGLVAAACSGSATSSGPGASTAPSSAAATPAVTSSAAPATPVPTKGPATQNLTLTGPAGAAGAVTLAGIRCNLPSPNGLQISVLGQPADPNLSVYIFVWPGNVTVRYDSGAGATYVERDFVGTGVTNFDPAKGVTIDSPLTEAATQDAHGKLGVLSAISGTIDCGNQVPGSSTLAFSGPTTKGAISGGLDPVNVECVTNTYGKSVSIIGIGQVDSTPTEVIISISPGAFTAYPVGAGFYRNNATAVATLTTSGAHVEGDAVEQLAAGVKTKPHTIHVSGDVVCGTTIGG